MGGIKNLTKKMDLVKLTIKQAHNGLMAKEFSAKELTEAFLARIKKEDGEIHAFLETTADLAREAAVKIDARIKAGEEIGILEGVPCAIKDNMLVE
ncbi:MAG: amidase family protein, partial [Candidatus Portnoybacteria bacterium]|nr:amidase family protein [Candidatus Portnoybacteria bacterium]